MKKITPNLSLLSLNELVDLSNQLRKALDEKIEAERINLQDRLAIIESLQTHVRQEDQLSRTKTLRVATQGTRRSAKAPDKYRGPNGETWSGRGLTPRWLTKLEVEGKARDQYLIVGKGK